MNGIVFKGDVKRVTETLEAFADLNEGMTVIELVERFERMTDEQKERYIKVITEAHRQFGGRSEVQNECVCRP